MQKRDLGIACLALLVICVAASVNGSGPGTTRTATHTVTYVVKNIYPGTDKWDRSVAASITTENGSGGTEQDDVKLPWTKEFAPESGQFLYVSAQDKGGSRGVEVSILLDGKEVRHATSTAQYGIASVSARMP